jgi:predicted N-acyltransferase
MIAGYIGYAAAVELLPHFPGATALLTDANAAISTTYTTFDTYAAALGGDGRRRVQRERKAFAASGYRLSASRLADCYELAGRLLASHHRRHGHDDTDEVMIAYLASQVDDLNERSHIVLCNDATTTVGFCLTYEWNERLYIRAAGLGAEPRAGSFALFNTIYYSAVELAIERGLSCLDLGTGTYQAKILRGAWLEPKWSLVEPWGSCAPAFQSASRTWNEQAYQRWDCELAAFLKRPTEQLWPQPRA